MFFTTILSKRRTAAQPDNFGARSVVGAMITILTSWFKTVDIVTWHIQDSKGALNDQMQEDSQATLNE